MKALIVLDCQKGMLARGNFALLKENILKLQEMFKASGTSLFIRVILTRVKRVLFIMATSEESLTKSFLRIRILSLKKTRQIFSRAKN